MRRLRATATLLPLLSLALAAGSSAQDPFEAGERWNHAPSPGQAWIPDDVHFVAGGQLVWTQARGNDPRWTALDGFGEGELSERFTETTEAGEATVTRTAAARAGRALFTLAQYPAPTIYERVTELTRRDPVQASQGGGFGPQWTHVVGGLTNGAARVATDAPGSLVAAAVFQSDQGAVRLDLLAGDSGALAGSVSLPALALDALVVSADGTRVAVAAGLDLYVLDASANVLFHQALASASRALALSGDGRTLALGSIGQLVVFTDTRGVWTPGFQVLRPQSEIATVAALDADGDTLAVSWWKHTTGRDLRHEVWDAATGGLVNQVVQLGSLQAKQNKPSAVRVTPDGSRIAFASWGDGLQHPEVLLLDKGEVAPVLALDLEGSARALDLSDDGRRVVVSLKDVHNNDFSSSGAVRLFDTGEGHLRQRTSADVGEPLDFSVRRPGATVSLLLLGVPAEPTLLPGVSGTLDLYRPGLVVQPRILDLEGRADHTFFLPDDPALVGASLSVQSAFRSGGGTEILPEVVDLLVL